MRAARGMTWLAGLAFLAGALAGQPAESGVYAIFRTSLGDLTVRLYYNEAPYAAANLVRLAEGSQGWLDYETGTVRRTRYFDGAVIDQAVAGAVAVGGARGRNLGDGPGYFFRSERRYELFFNRAGLLAMYSPVGLDANGAEFFFTLGPQPGLDYQYTIFGEVAEGLSNLLKLNDPAAHPTDPEGRLLAPVTINRVDLVRVGAAANAWNAAAVPLPALEQVPARFAWGEAGPRLAFPRAASQQVTLFHTGNFAFWAFAPQPFDFLAPAEDGLAVAAQAEGRSQRFFRVTAARYTILTPRALGPGAVLDCRASSGLDRAVITVAPDGSAGYLRRAVVGESIGEVTQRYAAWEWQAGAHSGGFVAVGDETTISPVGGPLGPFRPDWDWSFTFDTATTGRFFGTVSSTGEAGTTLAYIDGTFTYTPGG